MRTALRLRSERGTALLETALTLPLLLAIAVGIFEFGRAYQTWQVLTNAAREGARVAVLPYADSGAASARVSEYLKSGQIPNPEKASVVSTLKSVAIGGGATANATEITVSYPFEFIVLQPVARLLVKGSAVGAPLTMVATAVMRNE